MDQPGTLYIVSTPIGNMEDMTLRAIRVLKQADIIAAEDTRHTGRMFSEHCIQGRMISCHEHNEKDRTPYLLEQLQQGKNIALVSDAGTPSVSDPGFRLVQAAAAARIPVVPIPGASAALTALSISGLPTDMFTFVGFPHKKGKKRQDQLHHLADRVETLIFYESPKRILSLLADISDIMGDRKAVLCREMTKSYEEFLRGQVFEIINILEKRETVKGECTLVLEGNTGNTAVSEQTLADEIIRRLDAGQEKLSKLSKNIAARYGLSKKDVYAKALEITNKRKDL